MTPVQTLDDTAPRRFLFLEGWEWSRAILISAAIAGLAALYSYHISIWISVTVFLTVLTLQHMTTASRFILPLPHIAILMASLQYVLAAWISYYWPPINPEYDIGDRLPLYLSYGAAAVLALALGWVVVLIKLLPKRSAPEIHSSPRLLLELDVLLGISGVATFFATLLGRVESLAFIFVLLSNLRYLSVYARMLVRGRGWSWRLALVLAAEILFAAGSGMLHTLLLWSLWTFAIWIYRFTPPRRAIFAVLAAAVVLLPALQESKWRLRQDVAAIDPTIDIDEPGFKELPVGRVVTWASYLTQDVAQTVTLSIDRDFIADISVRYNQGWIINRIMAWVPQMTPYAGGATIKDAVIASIFPRFVLSGKTMAGGRENMLRYAGMEMVGNTSMNLGYAGEMYANFGHVGGLIGCALYAVALGLLFRVMCRRAFIHPLWWSLVPYVFFAAVKAEDGIDLVANWSVKSCVLLLGISTIFPAFRQALF
ncbi:MAG TPA: hypothetical protein VGU64_21385, partial [Terriglobales bacterium]|nr:hypothetical protein [Terriglobales bacterium]